MTAKMKKYVAGTTMNRNHREEMEPPKDRAEKIMQNGGCEKSGNEFFNIENAEKTCMRAVNRSTKVSARGTCRDGVCLKKSKPLLTADVAHKHPATAYNIQINKKYKLNK